MLATGGFLQWDGTDDDGQRARTGYYLLHIEVFDLQGNREVYRMKAVVGTKLK